MICNKSLSKSNQLPYLLLTLKDLISFIAAGLYSNSIVYAPAGGLFKENAATLTTGRILMIVSKMVRRYLCALHLSAERN